MFIHLWPPTVVFTFKVVCFLDLLEKPLWHLELRRILQVLKLLLQELFSLLPRLYLVTNIFINALKF